MLFRSGDIALSLFCLASRRENERNQHTKILVAESQLLKTKMISSLLKDASPILEDFCSSLELIPIDGKLVQATTQTLKEFTSHAPVWGPRIFYSDQVGSNLFSLWPGASSHLGRVLETSSSWGNAYFRYALDQECMQDLVEEDHNSILTHKHFDRAFVSLSANSFTFDQLGATKALINILNSFQVKIKTLVYSLPPSASHERPDLSAQEQSNKSQCLQAISDLANFAEEFQLLKDLPFEDIVANVNDSDLVITFRSGITDLASIVGKSLLTIYPSIQEFSWFKVTRDETVVGQEGVFPITFCSPTLKWNPQQMISSGGQ